MEVWLINRKEMCLDHFIVEKVTKGNLVFPGGKRMSLVKGREVFESYHDAQDALDKFIVGKIQLVEHDIMLLESVGKSSWRQRQRLEELKIIRLGAIIGKNQKSLESRT